MLAIVSEGCPQWPILVPKEVGEVQESQDVCSPEEVTGVMRLHLQGQVTDLVRAACEARASASVIDLK